MPDVTTRGPFFDSRRTRFTDDFCGDVLIEVVEEAHDAWRDNMRRTFKHPTGTYIRTTRVEVFEGDVDVAVVNDGGRLGGLIYGPWLEGVTRTGVPHNGGRRGSRFKGYWNLRKARQSTERKVARIAAPIRARYYGRMNGR